MNRLRYKKLITIKRIKRINININKYHLKIPHIFNNQNQKYYVRIVV